MNIILGIVATCFAFAVYNFQCEVEDKLRGER